MRGLVRQSVDGKVAPSSYLRLLTALIVILIAIPSSLIFGPLGGAGTPAQILGLVLLVSWLVHRITTIGSTGPWGPVRYAMLLFVASAVASYVAAALRAIPAVEQRAADRGLLSILSWLGMLLVASDGLVDLAQLNALLRRLTTAGGLLALLGLVQFVSGMPFTNYIQIPGLTANSDLAALVARGTFNRPAGTTSHPIEFGAVITMILPIALHYAIIDVHRGRVARWFPVAAIAVAVPISISRSAMVGAAVALAFLLPTWTTTMRRRAYAAMLALFGCVYVTVPGLLGTIRGLFAGLSNDSSARSRTDSYNVASEFISRGPFFGRGFRTFLPSYRILDNQYLLSTIETGLVGLAVLLGLLITAIAVSIKVRRTSTDPATRQLSQALAASVAAAACSLAFYDAFSFPMAASLLFIVLGGVAALRRVCMGRERRWRASPLSDDSNGPFLR